VVASVEEEDRDEEEEEQQLAATSHCSPRCSERSTLSFSIQRTYLDKGGT
jgi:hypothetical protein